MNINRDRGASALNTCKTYCSYVFIHATKTSLLAICGLSPKSQVLYQPSYHVSKELFCSNNLHLFIECLL